MDSIYSGFQPVTNSLTRDEHSSMMDWLTHQDGGRASVASYVEYLLVLNDEVSLNIAEKLVNDNNAFKKFLSQISTQN